MQSEPPEPVRSLATPSETETASEEGTFGVLARFEKPDHLVRASQIVREARFTKWDTHSPFPVHGLERTMGLKRSRVPWFTLVGGLSGAALGMLMEWWISVQAYPLWISGKPLFSWPAFVPIMFECGVLGGALGTVAGLLISSRLPEHFHPLFHSRMFEKVTDDKFFISIQADDPQYRAGETEQLLWQAGASKVELISA
ncbi:MAG: DUF3341 domain-containing protein [Acidobacteriota bacterium]